MLFRTTIVLTIAGCGSPPPPSAAPQPSRPVSTETEPPTAPADEPYQAYDPPDVPLPPPSASASTTPAATSAPDPAPDPAEAKACAARGGKMQRVCMMGALECVVRHRDGGKRCTDGKECSSGKCVFEGTKPAPARAAGVCQRDSNPCGCRAFVVGGQVQPTLCAD